MSTHVPAPAGFRHPLWSMMALALLFALSVLLPPARLFAAPQQYLPLHTALETFAIVIAGIVFALGWNLRRTQRGGRLVWLGAASLAGLCFAYAVGVVASALGGGLSTALLALFYNWAVRWVGGLELDITGPGMQPGANVILGDMRSGMR